MNPSSEKVLRYLAGNENIEYISIKELQKLADENPYFPVAQFLLAKKLKSENQTGFLQQVQKTVLYFTNPYWLHYQLSNELWQDGLPDENTLVAGKIENAKLPAIAELSADEPGIETKSVNKTLPEKNENTEGVLNTEEANFQGAAFSKAKPENEGKAGQPEEEMAAITRDADAATEEFLNKSYKKEETFDHDNIEQVIMEIPASASTETTEVLEEMAGVSHETDETAETFLNEVQTRKEETSEQHLQTEVPPFTADSSKSNNNPEIIEPDEHERMFQNIKAMLDATSEEAEADVKNAAIPIDPYYTIDYFASQGIKLDLDPNPKDQLGQHLKKFTHWLKQMKKLGPEDGAEVIRRTDTDTDIQKIAESSNTVREVVTEAMASVLEKQGKNEKAAELYKKLSFLNPHKSAYFADKIKNLKGI